MEQESEVVPSVTRRFAIVEVFPWARSLPVEDVHALAADLIDALQAVEELDTTAPVAQVIAEWQHTAEVYADPELLTALRKETSGDFGPVPEPDVVG